MDLLVIGGLTLVGGAIVERIAKKLSKAESEIDALNLELLHLRRRQIYTEARDLGEKAARDYYHTCPDEASFETDRNVSRYEELELDWDELGKDYKLLTGNNRLMALRGCTHKPSHEEMVRLRKVKDSRAA